jgi:hypothetical protein
MARRPWDATGAKTIPARSRNRVIGVGTKQALMGLIDIAD